MSLLRVPLEFFEFVIAKPVFYLCIVIHNHEVAGSIPAPATLKINELQRCDSFLFWGR